ncbi:MAG: carbamoyl-phosphate synthase large subunit, partial [Paracoccaceae bacterium]
MRNRTCAQVTLRYKLKSFAQMEATMPKRTDINSIMIIGAGPIVIGQACEFDYSGAQACKALREEGYRVILVNSNPATIMTDPGLADATYIEPITPEVVARIIEQERPDALLPTMGGQTGLNTSLALADMGVLEKFNVELIGANRNAIEMAEDRKLFREAMDRIGLENPKATIIDAPKLPNGKYDISAGVAEAMSAIEYVGLPAIIRPAFTLGGTGGGVAYNRDDYEAICRSGLEASPMAQILVDESLLGWKEFEMEVVRDCKDNAIIVCAIENIDPMGVHTGDSITVAPALTLTDKEYQIMRNGSIAVLREIGVETGGSNVQWSVNPADGRIVVIEMNPRVSRSSALASKATGFPIAKIAAKLAVGYTLDELDNDITRITPASFEPSIDYVVIKIPRFAFEKFPGSLPYLTTSMKSVGEVMAIGRTIHESLQKALASLETGLTGFDEIHIPGAPDRAVIFKALSLQTPDRIRVIAQAMRFGFSDDDINQATAFDPWFLGRIREIIESEADIRAKGLPVTTEGLRDLKMLGFSDARLAKLTGRDEAEVRRARRNLGVHAVFKRIDTCAAEFEAQTPYMYSTYEVPAFGDVECEARPSNAKKVIILGGGPNRIGQGIEFDYCCVHACYALTAAGYETIMINCNPETVSTDYDTSDRLYFEPLTLEHVLEILRVEQEYGTIHGVIVQFGGQTPLKLANALFEEGIAILGTTPDAIDLAEDRERFQKLLQNLGLKQPVNGTARSRDEAFLIAARVGYPLVIRPSFVLGGRAMEIVRDDAQLERYIREAVQVSGDSPVLLDSYLSGAIEVDVDALSDGKTVHVAGIMEHIEEAGVHSGDSACCLPPHSLSPHIIAELKKQTVQMALA